MMNKNIRLFIALTLLGAASLACTFPFQSRVIRGSGNVVIEERDVGGFDKILITGAGRVIITQGSTEFLTIEGDDNLLEYIKTEVKGDILEIKFREGSFLMPGVVNLDPSGALTFRVGVVDLEEISVSGAAEIDSEKLKADQLMINFSGAGDIMIDDLNVARLDVVISGAGDVELIGIVEDQDIQLSGFGRYDASDLESKTASVNISGAGGAEVWTTEVLNVTISGAGDVRYYGDPVVNPEISGLGRIQGLGEK
jgi:hypothetical protein